MKLTTVFVVTFALFVALQNFQSANAQHMSASRVANGLSNPIFATHAPGDSSRLFVVEQGSGGTAQIQILDLNNGTVNANPFLSISNLSTGGERGLLGLAFHPEYQNNGLFYVNMTVNGGDTQIREYSMLNPDIANPNSARTLMTINQPFSNHNGGWMGFSPNDGMLYIATGDGGSGGDPQNNAQTITNNLLGKMLRIDPLGNNSSNGQYGIPNDNPFVGVAGDDEIWAYGLRNPWRNSFDRQTGDLYIGDVGQGSLEEINFQLGASAGGENYGWRIREGASGGVLAGAIDPIYDYTHGGGPLEGFSVTGGYVYRGPIAELQGHYFFADFVTSRIWSLKFDGSDSTSFDGTNFTDFIDWTDIIETDFGNINSIASFGEDSLGNLYIVDYSGEIFMITSAAIPEPLSGGMCLLAIIVMANRRRRK